MKPMSRKIKSNKESKKGSQRSLIKSKRNLSLKKSTRVVNKNKKKIKKRPGSKKKANLNEKKKKKKVKKKVKKRKIKIKKNKEVKDLCVQSKPMEDEIQHSVSSKMSRSDNILAMEEFKQALINEDVFNDKRVILPFLKYLENKEIFAHYFEEDFDSSNDDIRKGKIKISHGEIFHFLLLTNKFISEENNF